MTQNPSLQVLLEREEAERDAAFAVVQRLSMQVQAAQTQAEQLVAYRGEYQRRWSGQFAQGGAIEIVQCYQGFMGRLEQAVAQQQRIVQHQEVQLAQARQTLAACEMRVASVRKLIERREKEARVAADRREQKQTDEAAQRRAWAGPSRIMPLLG